MIVELLMGGRPLGRPLTVDERSIVFQVTILAIREHCGWALENMDTRPPEIQESVSLVYESAERLIEQGRGEAAIHELVKQTLPRRCDTN